MKSAPWLATLAAAAISLSAAACSKESKAKGAVADPNPSEPATPVEVEKPATKPQPILPTEVLDRTPPPTDPVADPPSKGNPKPDRKSPPPPQPPASGGAKSEGQHIDKSNYVVKVGVAGSYSAGKPGSVTIELTPKSGWHVNQDFPTKVEITAPAGVTLAKDKLRKDDATAFGEQLASFRVDFTPGAAGAADFTARFKFVVCNDDNCSPSTESLAWRVAVN
ncbi:MAG TPA: hypothetical protein VL172_04055 [Kofleriaceae bacterium]|jgi:hypothetical protein|nr:hypothetical protein [Kofleriaceae bacterium]